MDFDEIVEDEDEYEPAEELSDPEVAATVSAAVPAAKAPQAASAFVRAENEDDDGYDPYSDRPVGRAPLFERDPWA